MSRQRRCAPHADMRTVPPMTLILTILTAFPLGFFIANRTIAYIGYITAVQLVFTFQTAGLLLDWGGGDTAAFGGPFPDHDLGKFFGYGAVNLIIFTAGLGLVTLGIRLARRRRDRANRVELAG